MTVFDGQLLIEGESQDDGGFGQQDLEALEPNTMTINHKIQDSLEPKRDENDMDTQTEISQENQTFDLNTETYEAQHLPGIYGKVLPPEPEQHVLTQNPEETQPTKSKNPSLSAHNSRMKLKHRKLLKELFKRQVQRNNRDPKNRTGDQWTKNLLKVGKCSICQFFQNSARGRALIEHNPWLLEQIRLPTWNLENFDSLFKYDPVYQILNQYFQERRIYRDLMISRVTEQNKAKYMFYLEVFQENFRRREFLGISQTMQQIIQRRAERN